MVTFRRYPGSSVYLADAPALARAGVIVQNDGDTVDLAPALLTRASFAVWGDLSGATPAEIAAFFGRLANADARLRPGIGGIFFGHVAEATGASGVVEFSRTPPHAVANVGQADILLGARWVRPAERYILAVRTGAGGPTTISVGDAGLAILHPQPRDRFLFGKQGSTPPKIRTGIGIALRGSSAGALTFEAGVEDEASFATIDAGLRADFQGKQNGRPIGLHRNFPVFRPYRPAGGALHLIGLSACIDPFDLTPDRSRLLLSASDGQGGPGLIETYFLTNYGDPLRLRVPSARAIGKGRARAPQLVFALHGNGAGPFRPQISLLPDGDFDVALPDVARGSRRESFGIMCGLSEREFLPLEPRQRLAFRAGQPAFAGPMPEAGTAGDEGPYTAHTQTSWLAVVDPEGTPGTTVVAEDPEYSLYVGPDATRNASARQSGVVLLDHSPLRLARRPLRRRARQPADPATLASLPVIPWRGVKVKDDGVEARTLEGRVFVPKRRALLQPSPTQAPLARRRGAPNAVRYTPLGLEILLSANGRVRSLLLARVASIELRLDNIAADLADALLRRDLFLVCDTLEGLATIQAAVSIAGWGFGVDIPVAGAGPAPGQGSIIIIKGRRGILSSLLDEPECWALKNRLCSTTPDAMAARIRQLQADRPQTKPGSETETQKAAFARIDRIFSQDPDWTGVLIYNVPVDSGALPDQITGLLGGSGDIAGLRAHHVGIDVRRVDPTEPDAAPTPLFGVLAYANKNEGEPPKLPVGKHYSFRLDRLLVGFENGQIREFLAKGKLAIQRLFNGEASPPAKQVSATPYPVIDITGRYESRLQAGEKVDVYSFEADFEGKSQVLEMPTGGLVRSVEISRVVFVTRNVDRKTPGELTASTRFLIDGAITFNQWPAEVPVIDDGLSIAFTGMGIDFSFKLAFPKLDFHLLEFDFNAGGLSLDFGKLPTLKSLLGKLPFKFRTFEIWPEGLDFPKLGFTRLAAKRPDGVDLGQFGFTFDLDLGSLGALADKLKDFKLTLLLGFGYDKLSGRLPQFALGFKFAGSGGTGLDIGIGNVLKIKAESYDVGKHPDPKKDLYYAYALKAKLVVMGREFPESAALNIFLFVDPTPPPGSKQSPLNALGWFGVMTTDGAADGSDIVSLDTLALGQRILLFPGGDAPGLTVHGYVDKIRSQLGGSKLPKPVQDAIRDNKIEVVTRELLAKITYAPERDWMIALGATVAKVLSFEILFRDPDLYGIHIDLFNKLIDLDILYRKLSQDLGVYSVTLVPPEPLRRISTGAADIILPTIGLDFYTDGGFAAKLGYPANRDFSQSATVEILPFIGAGGLRGGVLKGGGSQLVPRPSNSRYRYNPVIELGLGFRVGLGKSFEKGPFRAAVALTVFAYLEGAQGRLKDTGNGPPAPPADMPATTFTVVRGAFGLLGEIFGSVDFGIVKALVEVVLYTETTVQLRTDDHVLAKFSAGISVNVVVVVARFRIFRATIEIKVSFSFSTTFEFEATLGSRRGNFDDVYGSTLRLPAAAGEWRELTPAETEVWLGGRLDWSPPSLSVLGRASPQGVTLWFLPDVTAAARAGTATPSPEAVFKLYLECELADPAAPSPFDRFAELMLLSLLWCGLRDLRADPATADDPRTWTIDKSRLDLLARKLSGPDLADGPAGWRLPTYAELAALYGGMFDLEIAPSPTQGSPRAAVFFPMPQEVEVRRVFTTGGEATSLVDRAFVTPAFEAQIHRTFDWLRALFDEQTSTALRSPRGAPGLTLAAVLFQEHAGFLFRTFVHAAQAMIADKGKMPVSTLLGELQSQRSLRDAGAAATRFFNHGLALPRPDAGTWTAIRTQVPADLAALGDADADAALPIFRYASLQLPLVREVPNGSVELAKAVGLAVSRSQPAAWFRLAPGVDRLDVGGERVGSDPIAELIGAASRLEAYAETLPYRVDLDRARIVREAPRTYSPTSIRDLPASGVNANHLLDLPTALTNDQLTPLSTVKVTVRPVDGAAAAEEALTVEPVTAVNLTLRRPKTASEPGRAIFEISGAREAERRLLDELSPLQGGRTPPPNIARVELYTRPATKAPLAPAIPPPWRRHPGIALVVQTNLTVDAAPEARFGILADGTDMQAAQDQPAAFVELVRRAAIVNSGGFWLLFDDPDAATDDFELLLVAVLKDATSLRGVNALLASTPRASQTRLAGLAGAQTSEGGAVVITAGEEERLLPRPGQLPLRISVPNPSVAYHLVLDGAVQSMTFDQAKAASKGRGARAQASITAAIAADHADAQLRERFHLLEVLIADGGDFRASKANEILPLGPYDKDADGPERTFVQALPLHKHLKSAPTNPYEVIGKRLHLQCRMRDINGNALPGRPRDAIGELGGPITVHYYDGLLSPAELPCLVVAYEPAPRPGVLNLRLSFNAAAYRGELSRGRTATEATEALRARARSIHKTYRTALWQAGGVGFALSVETTLAAGSTPGGYDPAAPIKIVLQQTPKLEAFYADVLKFVEPDLTARSISQRRRVNDPAVIIDVPLGSGSRAAFIEPSFTLLFERALEHVCADIRSIPNSTYVRHVVPASYELITSQAQRETAFGTFTDTLVTRTLGGGYVGALGGPASANRPGAALWLVRNDLLPSQTAPAQAPAYLAVPPLSNRPVSFDDLQYDGFIGGVTETRKVRLVDADLDVYGKLALDRVDELLAPRQVQRLTSSSEGRSALGWVLRLKESLARRLADRAAPVLADATPASDQYAAARAALTSRLMSRLGVAYEVDTLLSFALAWDVPAAVAVEEIPAVYGRLDLKTTSPALSAPAEPTLLNLPRGGRRSSPLTIFYDAIAPFTQAGGSSPSSVHEVTIGTFDITHIQRLPQPDRAVLLTLPSDERYRATQWLRLLKPWSAGRFVRTARVPIVLRELPTNPVITSQGLVPLQPVSSLEEARQWSLQTRWLWTGVVSDTLVANVDYWRSTQPGLAPASTEIEPLGEALLKFALATETCWSEVLGTASISAALANFLEVQLKAVAEPTTRVGLIAGETVRDVIDFIPDSAGKTWRPEPRTLHDKHAIGAATALDSQTGCLVVDHIDITKHSRAQFSLELYRNRSFDLTPNAPPSMADGRFVYHLTGLSTGQSFVPRLQRPDLLLSPLQSGSFGAHLNAILTALFGANPSPIRFDIHLAFAAQALPQEFAAKSSNGVIDWPGVPMPNAVGLNSGRPSDWNVLAHRVEGWLSSATWVDKGGFIQLNIKLFRDASATARSGAGAQDVENQPVLQLARVRIPLKSVVAADVT